MPDSVALGTFVRVAPRWARHPVIVLQSTPYSWALSLFAATDESRPALFLLGSAPNQFARGTRAGTVPAPADGEEHVFFFHTEESPYADEETGRPLDGSGVGDRRSDPARRVHRQR